MVNVEAKRRLKTLRQIARGLKQAISKLNLSETDLAVLTKLLKLVKLQIKNIGEEIEGQVRAGASNSRTTLQRDKAVAIAHSSPPRRPVLAGVERSSKRPRSCKDSKVSVTEAGEWKKPWHEVSGGAFGLGKSRKH
jgi:hypothetical protein